MLQNYHIWFLILFIIPLYAHSANISNFVVSTASRLGGRVWRCFRPAGSPRLGVWSISQYKRSKTEATKITDVGNIPHPLCMYQQHFHRQFTSRHYMFPFRNIANLTPNTCNPSLLLKRLGNLRRVRSSLTKISFNLWVFTMGTMLQLLCLLCVQ
jgi:hypothetical protein